MATPRPHIGTLREKSLHRSLKEWYAEPGDQVEVRVDGYVIDLVRGDLLIEIQTSGFSSMRDKAAALLDGGHRLRIVYPIAATKWLVKVSEEGEVLDRRRSPKKGLPTDLFAELVSFPQLLTDSDMEVEILMAEVEEYRHHTPGKSWRRKGWSVLERHLVEVTDRRIVGDHQALQALLPTDLPEPFTTSDLSMALGQNRRVAQQMAYCLRETGVMTVTGKRGNAYEYVATEVLAGN